MSSDKYCCVPGCRESGGMHNVLHKFPKLEQESERRRFNAWMYAVGGNILRLNNNVVYKHRRICRSHFEEKYLCRNNRISCTAIPTLNLPGPLSWTKYSSSTRIPMQEKLNLNFSELLPEDLEAPHLFIDSKPSSSYQNIEKHKENIDPEAQEQRENLLSTNIPLEENMRSNRGKKPKVYQQAMKAANPNRSKSNAEQKPVHVSSNDLYQCPVKRHDDTKITLTQFHIDNALQKISDDGARKDLKLKIPIRKYVYKPSAKSRQIEDLKPISSLPKTGIVRVPPETRVNEELCGVIEEDHCAEVSVVQPEVLFSWQQPSAVVPCDDDVMDEAGASSNECTESVVESTENVTLGGYRCDVCSGSIVGFRYTCVQCADYDICGSCEARSAHRLHYVLRVPGQRPHGEVTQVLHHIRRLLLADAVIDLPPGDFVEIKKEPCNVEDPIAGDFSFNKVDPSDSITNELSFDVEDPVTKHLSCDTDNDPLTDQEDPIPRELSSDEDDSITKELSFDEEDPITKRLFCDEDYSMEVVSSESEADNSKAKESCDNDGQISIQSSYIEDDPSEQICKVDDTVAEQTFKIDDLITIQSFKEDGQITVQSFKEDDSITVQSCDDDNPIVSHPACGEDNSMAFEFSWPNAQKSMPVLKRTSSLNREPVKLSRAADFRSDTDWTLKHAISVPLKILTILHYNK